MTQVDLYGLVFIGLTTIGAGAYLLRTETETARRLAAMTMVVNLLVAALMAIY